MSELDDTADELARVLGVEPDRVGTLPRDNCVVLTNAQARRLLATIYRLENQ